MEEKKEGPSKGAVVVPFLVGFVAAIAFGWWGFPQLLYSSKSQPLNFTHLNHVQDYGIDCEDCHYFRPDGSYAGLPSNEKCAECHSMAMTSDPDEIKFVEEYYEKGVEVPWLVYQYQPDNVSFSHAAHKDEDCTACHPDVGSTNELPPYYENRLTKYSKETMKMKECERCHAKEGASNACQVCHK
ncbi:MAG TPA: cytochrome C [Desulfonatronum sp.]|nr:cytochrome C [Desulfonatronum sp.]